MRLREWIKNQYPTICCLQEPHFTYKDTDRLKVKRWRKMYHANTNEKETGVAVLISDKADFGARKVIREKDGHCIII